MIYEFQATQDLHGYDKPWGPGMNINLLDTSTVTVGTMTFTSDADGYVTASPSLTDSRNWGTYENCQYKVTLPAGSYKIVWEIKTIPPESASWGLVVMTEEGTGLVNRVGDNFTNNTSYPFTLTEETNVGVISKLFQGSVRYMIVSSSSPTTWSPYANVCMPEGFNIWDPHNDEFIQVYAGYVNANTRELYLRPVYEEYAGEELVGPWMSSWDPYAEDTTPTEGAFVIDFGGELNSFEITPFMLQTLLDSLGIRQHFTNGAGLLNSLMDQAQGRVRSEEELLHLSRPLNVIAIGDQLPAGITFKPISKDVLPGLPGKFIR